MERDLRETDLYKELEAHYLATLGPAFGRVSSAEGVDPSPDGRRVAFAGGKREKLEGMPATRVCVVDVETGRTEEITGGPNDDRAPRWSPDGLRLSFLSDRVHQGRHQLYLLEAGRVGEAVAAPVVEGTVEYQSWSPDGSTILLGVAGTGAELAGVQGSGSTKETADELPSWTPTVRRPAAEDEWRRIWAFDVGSGEIRAVSREGLNVWESSWCGNDRLVAIVSDGPGEDAWYTAPLALIDLVSGKERILSTSDRQLGIPAASPDGRRVAVVQALCSDRMVVAGDVLLADPDNGDEPTPVDTGGVDVQNLAWRTNDRLLFVGMRGLDSVVGEIDASTGTVTELHATAEAFGVYTAEARPTGDGDGFVTVVQSFERHPEVAVVEGGSLRTLTALGDHEGARHSRSTAGTYEAVSWTAPDGLEIQGHLIRPEGDGPHPMILWVHGGPIAAVPNDWPSGLPTFLASRGYAILIPNPRGSAGRGQTFAEMVYGDMGGADADDDLAGIDAMVERGVADPARLAVIGGSYGGFMSCWLPTRTDRFAAAVAISPVTDWYSQHWTSNIGRWDADILRDEPAKPDGEYFRRSPVMFASRVKTPTLLTAGLQDRCTPPGQAVEFFQALVENGVEAELALYPEEGHGVRKFPTAIDFGTRVVSWFDRHLGDSASHERR